ncbi:hypothetical protein GWN63_01345, partial [Candidatus Bathyarchaeota archaeon]|nr:hypothetical protein [Candidatus Bathyarchaeota archaeon]NIU80882.1 hypothetical protein [Candidatus Bathyarchaeota archaeon]NIV67534.1 hypothetical protein [Candidatus Bathyarchaeota archaeon]
IIINTDGLNVLAYNEQGTRTRRKLVVILSRGTRESEGRHVYCADLVSTESIRRSVKEIQRLR